MPSTSHPSAASLAKLKNLMNIRDLGGLHTRDGRQVRSGLIYRCATPMFLDAADSRVLVDELGIRNRIDLRRSIEIADGTSLHLAEVEKTVAHFPIRALGEITEGTGDRWKMLANRYASYLENSAESIKGIIELLAGDEGLPALIHCSAGKDRTGAVCALILMAVGVTEDDVVTDYALTSEHISGVFAQLRGVASYAERLARIPEESTTADPRTMKLFLETLSEVHGGALAYLRTAGVGDRTIRRLHDVLIGD